MIIAFDKNEYEIALMYYFGIKVCWFGRDLDYFKWLM